MLKSLAKSALFATAIMLSVTSAFAAQQKAHQTSEQLQSWQSGNPTYDFKSPTSTSCKDFAGAQDVYKSYVVAYLTGRHHKRIEANAKFAPVSVAAVDKQCTAQPGKSVADIVAHVDTAAHPGHKAK